MSGLARLPQRVDALLRQQWTELDEDLRRDHGIAHGGVAANDGDIETLYNTK